MQGSLAQQSSREKPQTLRPEVQDKLPVLDGHAITDDRVVENTFINQTAVNEDAFMERMDLVAGFPEGRIIVVTYFSQKNYLLWRKNKRYYPPTKSAWHLRRKRTGTAAPPLVGRLP